MAGQEPRTVEIAPSINDRLMLAVGSGRAELLPDGPFVTRQVIAAGEPTHETIIEWIMFSVELCRLTIEMKWAEANREGAEG